MPDDWDIPLAMENTYGTDFYDKPKDDYLNGLLMPRCDAEEYLEIRQLIIPGLRVDSK